MLLCYTHATLREYTEARWCGGGWHSTFYIQMHMYTPKHSQKTRNLSCIGRDRGRHTQGDLTYRCRGDTNQREKPCCVCACVRVCMCVCALVIVTEAGTERGEREIGGGPAGIHVLPGLFKVYVSFFYYPVAAGGKYWPGQYNYQDNKFSIAMLVKWGQCFIG